MQASEMGEETRLCDYPGCEKIATYENAEDTFTCSYHRGWVNALCPNPVTLDEFFEICYAAMKGDSNEL